MNLVENVHSETSAMFLVTFFDKEWSEIERLRRWTNDGVSVAREAYKMRLTQWEGCHSMPISNKEYDGAFLMCVEVCHE